MFNWQKTLRIYHNLYTANKRNKLHENRDIVLILETQMHLIKNTITIASGYKDLDIIVKIENENEIVTVYNGEELCLIYYPAYHGIFFYDMGL